MKPIIPPVDKELLKAELNDETLLRESNRAGNKLYVVGPEAVNVIREIGRLREIAFRNDGGGTGEPLDIDKFDTDPAYGYRQLVLWDPDAEQIIGGYRFCICDEAVYGRDGQPILTSSHMFQFSKKFIREYLPHTLELGRSFISLEYQSSKAGSKMLYALDNLFDGIAALGVMYKDRIDHFFGKMTIYREFPTEGREMIQVFLRKYFGKRSRLIKIRKEVKVANPRKYRKLFRAGNFKDDYKTLKAEVMKLGVSIPPLVNTYMNLSPSMIYFGTGINDEFGDIYDSGILISFKELYPDKINRHSDTFSKIGWRKIKQLLNKFQKRHLKNKATAQ
ncbi:MAG: GNAT family N-acetyltransferase [Bacteroidales bacterium]|nr:GNAT family N-acetyltransferase [Bacteroidales bacterium]